MIKVIARLVDGGLLEFEENNSFISSLHSLQKQGYDGKDLIHKLITDDWGPPPIYVDIIGTTSDGKKISERIPYT